MLLANKTHAVHLAVKTVKKITVQKSKKKQQKTEHESQRPLGSVSVAALLQSSELILHSIDLSYSNSLFSVHSITLHWNSKTVALVKCDSVKSTYAIHSRFYWPL